MTASRCSPSVNSQLSIIAWHRRRAHRQGAQGELLRIASNCSSLLRATHIACRLHLTCFYHTPRAERHQVLCYSVA
jgi:hypothetical protein